MNLTKILIGLEEIRGQTKTLYKIIGNTIFLYRQSGSKISLGEIRMARRKLKYYQDNCPHLEILEDHAGQYLWCNICGGFLIYYSGFVKCYSDGIKEIFGELDNIPFHRARIEEGKFIQRMKNLIRK